MIQISPSGGFTGTVNLTCAVTYMGTGTASAAPTCSLNPTQVQVSGSSASQYDSDDCPGKFRQLTAIGKTAIPVRRRHRFGGAAPSGLCATEEVARVDADRSSLRGGAGNYNRLCRRQYCFRDDDRKLQRDGDGNKWVG